MIRGSPQGRSRTGRSTGINYQNPSFADNSPLGSIHHGEMPGVHRRLDLILGESHLAQSEKQRSDSLQHMFTRLVSR